MSSAVSSDPEVTKYRNFLAWLYATFGLDDGDGVANFRRSLVRELRLSPGAKVLNTGCGLGDDVTYLLEAGTRELDCVDISESMVTAAKAEQSREGVRFHVADACALRFPDASFDAAFHFGGLNVFSDRKAGIHEMARVVKDGGRVVFGDEGVAPWLRETDYGKMAISNNALWAHSAPVELLPQSAVDVSLKWVLGNCFYLIAFTVQREGPYMNADVPHKSPRGGSMRSRYEGR